MFKKIIIAVCSVLVLTLLVIGGVLLYFVQKLPIEIPVQEYIKYPNLDLWPAYTLKAPLRQPIELSSVQLLKKVEQSMMKYTMRSLASCFYGNIIET